ncbi:MAG: hypothetical protein PHZ09_03155 [Eubacteriales bacterium]|nr:hypothetical protein [Eubacteriales bacterium]
MFRALVRTRMQALISFLFRGVLKKKRSVLILVLFALLMIYVFASFILLFGGMFYPLSLPLHDAGLGWLYFAIAGITAFVLSLMGSVFSARTQLFEAKDNEMLLAMPIPPGYILASRMVMLLVMNAFFILLVALPAGVVYFIRIPGSATQIIFFIAVFTLLPLPVTALSCVLGWLLALINTGTKHKSLITVISSLVFLFGYFYLYSRINVYLNRIIQNGNAVARTVQRVILPAYHLGYAVAETNTASLFLFFITAVLPFWVVYIILSKSFLTIATTKRGTEKIIYEEKEQKASGVTKALVVKELRHFISSPMYMLNASLGVIFAVILPFAVIIKKDQLDQIISMMPGYESMAGPVAVIALCILAATNFISAPSISLEGKNLWILQSFPVDGGDVLLSKAYAHMTVCLPPGLFASVMLAFILDLTPFIICLLIAVPAVMTVFQALLGVVINLRFPKFDWISETVAVKQSLSSVLTMFGSLAVVTLPIILYIYLLRDLMSAELCITLFGLLLGAASALMYRFLKTKGNEIYAFLG